MDDDKKLGNAIFVGFGIFIIGIVVWMLSGIFGMEAYSNAFIILYSASCICGTLYYLLKK